ncbi:hypothetical protein [Pseudomonas turukhanskensis]|uniref:Uncharacterized protein n=1 Tax=Pseudomonas turukhanskensis TaxID=1806536 RepID=A0A9W6NF71_9PSED|nr:hypothetical protein [Pseudomonas turukhanskensis]GLK89379.1 hypothetical protein GCM10017655_24410 [Pseudomonas turukhanskensis]
MNYAEQTMAILGGSGILCLAIWICIALRIGYTQMDSMLAHLKNSSAVVALAPLKNGGPWGVLLLVGGISGFLTFPEFYIKRGTINAKDIEEFPAKLKRKLTILQWSVIALMSLMTLLFAIRKTGLLK